MPQIKFTDTNLKTLSADSTTWFSDPTCKGLQLCVTAGGVKTWYVNKWDSTAQKTRRVKLGQWSAQGKHTAWAKKQVGKTAHDIDEGAVKTRQEREAEAASKAVPPTLREAFELEAASRLALDDAFGGPRAEETVQNYRSVLERKLDGLLDTRVDEIDQGEIQRRLDALTKSAPFAAHKLHIALSYARTQALSALNIEHMPFRWPAMKKMPIMRDRKDKDREGKVTLDTSVEWADRWAEIEGVENEHIRLAWMLRWHTGMRGRMLRNLTWADIDLTAGTMLLSTGLKKVKGKRLIAMTQPQYSIVYTETVKNLDYTDLVDMVVARLRKLKHWNLLCDASGMGGPVVSLFHQASVRCTGVTITAGSTITRDGSKVTCSKNLLLENLATQIENGSCVIAHDLPGRDQLLQEIAAFELTFTSAGNPVLHGGGKGHHSDTAIAAALALLGETHLSSRAMEVRRLQGFF